MQAIRTRYHGPTNTRGSRIGAETAGGHRLSIPYPHELSGEDVHRKAAVKMCRKMGWTGCDTLVGGGLRDGTYVFNFLPSGCRCPKDAFPRKGLDGLRRQR